MSGQSNVQQPSPQIGVGFGPVVKFREIYVLHTEAQNTLISNLSSAVALGDLLHYNGENVVQPGIAADGLRPAGFAAYEAVVNSTGVFGYKPQAGDPIGVYKKGRFYVVNTQGVINAGDELVVGSVAGSVRTRPGGNTDPTIGLCRVSNEGVSGNPIEAEIDTTVVQGT
jgi:hypothetical protein